MARGHKNGGDLQLCFSAYNGFRTFSPGFAGGSCLSDRAGFSRHSVIRRLRALTALGTALRTAASSLEGRRVGEGGPLPMGRSGRKTSPRRWPVSWAPCSPRRWTSIQPRPRARGRRLPPPGWLTPAPCPDPGPPSLSSPLSICYHTSSQRKISTILKDVKLYRREFSLFFPWKQEEPWASPWPKALRPVPSYGDS